MVKGCGTLAPSGAAEAADTDEGGDGAGGLTDGDAFKMNVDAGGIVGIGGRCESC